jgi:hypothetical protein
MAWKFFQQSLTLNKEAGDIPGVTASLISMARMALNLNKHVIATRLYSTVERRLESLSGNNLLTPDQIEFRSLCNQLSTYLTQATFASAFTEGWEMSEEQALGVVEEIIAGENIPIFG